MKQRNLVELVELMQPAAVEVYGEDCVVGPDVVTDSRAVTEGAIFVAIPGERVDGHAFAVAAESAGAAVVMGSYVTDASIPHLLGENSVQTLSWLARGLVREARAAGMVSVGVTGSSGKTSTKDLIAQVLERRGPTVSPVGSQNNEIGVPLTACRIDDETAFLVSELGARGLGHIKWLTSLVPLDIAVVVNVGQAHAGEFGGIEVTQKAKTEIVEDLGADGWAVLNGDDPRVAAMADATKARLAWVGLGELPAGELQVRAREVRVDELSRPNFVLEVTDDTGTSAVNVDLQVVGRHQVSNALLAAAVGLISGLSLDAVAAALREAGPRSPWRMAVSRGIGGAIVVNDAYNANPDSMAAALHTAAELIGRSRERYPAARLIAVLGDMLELGEDAVQAHEAVGRLAHECGVSELIAVGEHARDVARGAANVPCVRVAMREEVAESLRLTVGDVVLVKGSRGVGLELVAQSLEEKQ
ncbi:UDP-N-acetylmuramoyl-tripeptide--D-alanyl-D-alanine ligase [Tessaracoccus sp. OH4464_COT-324]|uniref:UDP-N-acetylmuramoyl-tripeptide--D-alanyl-D- alanine ligase n=1 Tax=Tessaracoccus sp. OH4464_COT-324 TaxID=2491059 RepID=UPI000F62F85E|nr:UDP-N-acetylmuramoyl-tripeptide--D-alanyl-D-alanine ligase [Tessaracoccus sp. OH4464_COT-324]RRD47546.1 UDP-N-acetylmuramoyl-tripeptide--D-alanyl-D-alanine ligase [Tessaracoccus sp. OH4464_COT-324]